MNHLLIIDDNPAVLTSLSILFKLNGYSCLTTTSPTKALQVVATENIALVISDMNFQHETTSGEEGKRLFFALRELQPNLPIILLTGWADLSTAVELVKAGAINYLSKPWDDNKLLAFVNNLLNPDKFNQQPMSRLQARQQLATRLDLAGLVYESEAMQQLLTIVLQIAKSDVPVLITGANGCGKEKIAEIIQRNSQVRNGPFVCLNVGALPLNSIEAEMFGVEANTHATDTKEARIGHFEMADGGTLFLDEIGNLPLVGQIKLLRVLQTGEFQRVGSSTVRRAKVRLISASNTDLPGAIKRGEFREDLFYRLNVIELNLPSLIERKEDIVPLALHFLQGRTISAEALRALESYNWPGNIRELQNTIRRACLLATANCIELSDLQLPQQLKIKTRPLFEPDEQHLRQTLKNSKSIAEAARNLGLSRQALYRRLEKFGIDHNEF